MKLLIAVLITLSIIIAPTSALAYVQVLGKKDLPPGQEKKIDVNVGRVEKNNSGKLEINNKGKKVEINTNTDSTIFEKPSGKRIAPGQIKKDDEVATFKKPNDATGSAHLILVKPKKEGTEGAKPETRRRAVYGLVRSVSGNMLVISHPLKDNPRYQVDVGGALIRIKGIASPTAADIKVGDRVSAVGVWSGDVLAAKMVHVIPGRAIGLLEKVATGSASPTATPSATPTATPSASP